MAKEGQTKNAVYWALKSNDIFLKGVHTINVFEVLHLQNVCTETLRYTSFYFRISPVCSVSNCLWGFLFWPLPLT